MDSGIATTLTGVTLSNTVDALTGFTYVWPVPAAPGRLAPGQTVTISASHLVTQTDVDAGTVRNVATGVGTPPTGADVSHRTPATIIPLVGGAGSMTVDKTGTRLGDGSVGTQVRYDFVVRNTGTFTLTSIDLADPIDGLSEIEFGAWPTQAGRLAPGESVTASATYTIRQGDVDAGEVRNVASASAFSPGGDPVIARSPESLVPTIGAAPSIDVEKTQTLAVGATGRPGDRVDFAFTVRNDGNVTLRGVTLADGQAGLSGVQITWPGETGVLAPGQSATAVGGYLLTRADVDAGRIGSAAVTTGIGSGVVVSDEAPGETLISAAPALTIVKTAEFLGAPQQGATARYTMTVANTGNVSLADVVVTDELEGLGAQTANWPGVPGVLAPGETATITADYVVTLLDVTRGRIDNTASAAGTAPGGVTVSASDSVRLDVPNEPRIRLGMSISVQDGQKGFAGDTLVFRYGASNTGTTILTGVVIADPYPGLSPLTYVWPGEPGVLLPGQTVAAVATVAITPTMEGTVVTSRAVVTSLEAESGLQVVDAASGTVALPAPSATGLLPFTGGGDPLPLVGGAAFVLLAGLVLMVVGRSRRRSRNQNQNLPSPRDVQ